MTALDAAVLDELGELLGPPPEPEPEEDAFDERRVETGRLFAAQASIVMANTQAYWDARSLNDQLHQAIESREAIEQAKGIVMARHGVDPEEAFRLLAEQSQRSNRRVRDLAVELVESTARRRRDDGGRPTVR